MPSSTLGMFLLGTSYDNRFPILSRKPGHSPGDTPYDAEAAGKLHLRTIGVLCGGWTEEELRQAGCVAIYRDPADLLARYQESPLG